jgi:5-methylcytosine-specific restriction endonuclease McrA
MPMTKRCSKCGEEKPATSEFFHRRSTAKDGLFSYCKPCSCRTATAWNQKNAAEHSVSYRRWAAENRGRVRILRKKWKQNNQEKVKASDKSYRLRNEERLRAYDRGRYPARKVEVQASRSRSKERNPSAAKRYGKHYRERHREAIASASRQRRAVKCGLLGRHTATDILKLYSDQAGQCFYCGTPLGGSYHVDHKVPVMRTGSTNWPKNLCCACPPCNLQKQDKTADEYIRFRQSRGLPVREGGV